MGLLGKLFNIGNSNEIKDTPIPPAPTNTSNEQFHMVVEDVFTITGRGTVVTGRVDSGEIHVGDYVNINGSRQVQVAGVEMFRKTLDYAKAGDNCGLLLKDISKDDIKRNDYLTK